MPLPHRLRNPRGKLALFLLLPERRISLLSLTCMVCKEHTRICFAYRPSGYYQPSELSLLPGAKSQGPPLHPGRGSSKGWKEPGLATHSPLDFLSPSLAKPHFWKAGFTFYESGQCKKKLISYRAVHRWIGGGGERSLKRKAWPPVCVFCLLTECGSLRCCWAGATSCLDAFRTSPASVRLRWGVPSCRMFYVFPITWMCCSWFDHLQNRAVTSWATPVNTNSWKESLFHGSPHHLGRSPGAKEKGEGGPVAHHAVTLRWEARGPSQDIQQYSPAHRTRYLWVCYIQQEAQRKLHGCFYHHHSSQEWCH